MLGLLPRGAQGAKRQCPTTACAAGCNTGRPTAAAVNCCIVISSRLWLREASPTPSMRHSWLLCLPLAASLAPVDQIKTLLKLGRIEGATGYHELDSGFCNSVYRVDTNKKPVVVKIYSAMAKARCAPACRGVVDEAVGAAGLGPQIHVRTDDALVAEFVDGETLTERDLKDEETALAIAPKLAQLHAARFRRRCRRSRRSGSASTRCSLAKATRSTRARCGEKPRGCGDVRPGTHADVLGHGDPKLSNVLMIERGGITFIDFELAGPNYRGYDIFKLFRTSKRRRRPTLLLSFVEAYLGEGATQRAASAASWKRSSSSRSRGSRRRYSSPSPRRRSRRSARRWRHSRGTVGALTRTAQVLDLMPLCAI